MPSKCESRAKANGAPCEKPTATGLCRRLAEITCSMSSVQEDRVLPQGADPTLPAQVDQTRSASNGDRVGRRFRKASEPLIAAPVEKRTARPLGGPHSYQVRRRPSRRRIDSCRSGLLKPFIRRYPQCDFLGLLF